MVPVTDGTWHGRQTRSRPTGPNFRRTRLTSGTRLNCSLANVKVACYCVLEVSDPGKRLLGMTAPRIKGAAGNAKGPRQLVSAHSLGSHVSTSHPPKWATLFVQYRSLGERVTHKGVSVLGHLLSGTPRHDIRKERSKAEQRHRPT